MKKFQLFLIFLLIAGYGCQTSSKEITFDETVLKKADSLAHAFIITDGHIDLPYFLRNKKNILLINENNGHVVMDASEGEFDYKRAKEGGLDAPFMSVYIPSSYQETGGAKALADSLIDLVQSIVTTFPDHYALAGSPAEVVKNFREGKISLPMGMENGAPIEGELANINYFFERGIRYITLTHGQDNEISDSSYDSMRTHNGLSNFGRSAVEEMNRTGMMVDVSHISDSAFYDVIEVSKVPVIASHSSCRHFTPGFERNMSDELIQVLAKNGGVIQINFGSTFLDSASMMSAANKNQPFLYSDVYRVADHIDHVVKIAGIDHVGLGSDFDGVGDTLPEGLKDVSAYPNLIAVLLERGYSDEDIAKICFKNVFRVWNQVLDQRNVNAEAMR